MSGNPSGQADSSVIVGIVVVMALVGAAIFGIYYFGFVRPERAELQDAKDSAVRTVNGTLGKVDTTKANSAAAEYKAKIQAADSKSEVKSIVSEVSSAYEREAKRKELLAKAKEMTHGSFYTLDKLYEELTGKIQSKTTLSDLSSLEDSMDDTVTKAWKDLHLEQIQDISGAESIVYRKKNTPIYWKNNVSLDEAQKMVEGKTWKVLKEVKFEKSGTYAIPIVDTFKRAPTVESGSIVDLGVYDRENDNLRVLGANSEVTKVIYPKDALSTVSWSESEGDDTSSFSTNIWEEIKATEAGAGNASASYQDYASRVVESARNNNMGDFDLKAVYVVEVPAQGDAKILMKYEQYGKQEYDVVILPQV